MKSHHIISKLYRKIKNKILSAKKKYHDNSFWEVQPFLVEIQILIGRDYLNSVLLRAYSIWPLYWNLKYTLSFD